MHNTQALVAYPLCGLQTSVDLLCASALEKMRTTGPYTIVHASFSDYSSYSSVSPLLSVIF